MVAECRNKYGCTGVAYNARHKKPWSASIFNKLIGRYDCKEKAIDARMKANDDHGLKGAHLINSWVILRDIFKTENYVHLKLAMKAPYLKLVEQDKIENLCRVDPTKEYSSLNTIIESLEQKWQ